MWLAATNGNSKQKKGEASCTCSDPRGSSTMAKQGAADASQKPIDPSSLSITEALAGTFVATVFEFVQLNTVTPKVLNDAVALMYERTGIAQIKGTSRAPPPPPPDDSNITTAATAQEIWTVYKKVLGDQGIFLLNIAALGNNENGKHTSVHQGPGEGGLLSQDDVPEHVLARPVPQGPPHPAAAAQGVAISPHGLVKKRGTPRDKLVCH